jgi:hypothetical protein
MWHLEFIDPMSHLYALWCPWACRPRGVCEIASYSPFLIGWILSGRLMCVLYSACSWYGVQDHMHMQAESAMLIISCRSIGELLELHSLTQLPLCRTLTPTIPTPAVRRRTGAQAQVLLVQGAQKSSFAAGQAPGRARAQC